MKLIWIAPECPFPANTGGRIVTWKRLLYLSERNDIYLYTIIDESCENQYKTEILKVCREVQMYSRRSFYAIFWKCFFNPYPAVSRWNNDMRKDITQKCRDIRPDLVVVDFPQMYGVLDVEVIENYTIVLNQHNIEYEALKDVGRAHSQIIKRAVYGGVAKQMEWYEERIYAVNKIALYSFVSISDKKKFEQKNRLYNTCLAPVGAEIGEYPPTVMSRCAVFAAKMSYPANEAGAKWLVDKVWPVVSKACEKAELYLVGKEPSEELKKAAAKFSNVTVTGKVDFVDKYYEECNVVLVPIFNGGGVKVKLLEALGHGNRCFQHLSCPDAATRRCS